MDAEATPPQEEVTVTATVTVTGETAEIIRELAAVDGRDPEELVQEWVDGKLVIPPRPVTAEELEIFDGPGDLSSTVDETLKQGFGQ